jgi:hypothetical protein
MRKQEVGSDMFSIVHNQKYSMMSDTDYRPFLVHSSTYLLPESIETGLRQFHHLIVWAHSELIIMLRRKNI